MTGRSKNNSGGFRPGGASRRGGKKAKVFSRADQSVLGQWWWTVDRGTLAAVMALVIIGIVLVTAASPPVAERIGAPQFHFVKRHLEVLVPSLALMFGISLLSPRWIWRLGSVMLAGCVLALIYVLFAGVEIKGAQRWIHFPGISLQPSEFAKPAFAVVAAWFIAKRKENEAFPGTQIAAGLYLTILTLYLLQPDLGMSVVLSGIFGAQIFLAGFPIILVIGMAILGGGGLVVAYYAFAHVRSRIDRFLDPASGDNYQVHKSLEAFKNGGFFGTGPGQGEVKLQLPDAHADFIFSVAGEEMGLMLVALIIGLYAYILLRGFNRLMDCEDLFIVLATGGLLTMFGAQALVHMGSAVNILPAKGMTLPFISYGGSSFLAISISMGMILALTRGRARRSIAKGSVVRKKSGKRKTK